MAVFIYPIFRQNVSYTDVASWQILMCRCSWCRSIVISSANQSEQPFNQSSVLIQFYLRKIVIGSIGSIWCEWDKSNSAQTFDSDFEGMWYILTCEDECKYAIYFSWKPWTNNTKWGTTPPSSCAWHCVVFVYLSKQKIC